MLTQIYEVSTSREASALSEVGVDHIGILVGDGTFPRELSLPAAAAVRAAVKLPSITSTLFLSANLVLIAEMARALAPDIIHLGAGIELLSPADCSRLKENIPNACV